ncbi:MAG: PEP-CTERM sorting domain-containing protein [Acidobacteria bacterium]|nr:PEP-CTERM sorting domain-containing protein [Acidobacteriota bacterium]
MNHKLTRALAAGLFSLSAGWTAQAAGIPALVNFDPPNSPQGPSIFVAVPGPQTITTTPATFSGGVLLGFATFFPAIAFASAPNVYGTADFGNHLAKELTIDINPAYMTTEVSFALFNGETFNQSYVVNAFNGTSVVASQTLANIAPNFNSGYALADLVSLAGITKVTIAPTGAPSVWDFLIDSVAFNQNITSVIRIRPLRSAMLRVDTNRPSGTRMKAVA